MKKIIQNSLLGASISSTVFLLIGAFFVDNEVRKNSLFVIGLGLLIGLISSVYESEKLSLLAKTGLQFVGGYISFLIIAYLGHWFPFQLTIIFTASVLFILIFFIIWTVFYFIEKNELNHLNEKLDKS